MLFLPGTGGRDATPFSYRRFEEDKKMNRKHKVRVCVADSRGNKEELLTSRRLRLPQRVLRFLFGETCEVLVLSPGRSVQGIEISEMREDGDPDEQ